MKMKKFLALVLSAVMAVSMLAACGGGGGSLNLSEVNAIVSEYSGSIRVRSSGALNSAIRDTAAYLEQSNSFTEAVASSRLTQIRAYPISDVSLAADHMSVAMGDATVVSESDLASMGMSIEDIVALALLAAEAEMKADSDYAEMEKAGWDITWYAGATKATAKSGAGYWVIGFEVELEGKISSIT